MGAPFLRYLPIFVLLSSCSNDLLQYRTHMWHECQGDLARTKQRAGMLQTARRGLKRRLASMKSYLASCRQRRALLEGLVRSLKDQLAAQTSLARRLKEEQQRTAERVAFMRSLLEKLKSMVEAGNLRVTLRKGRMILNLPNKILFEPGRARLMEHGKDALRKLATVLKEIRDRDLVVAGHTDSQPIKHSRYRSNWELSVARAVAVVEFLQKEGVDPSHLSAAGYGMYDPVADNGTEEGRALNRRIEIIVMPKIDELPSWEGVFEQPHVPAEAGQKPSSVHGTSRPREAGPNSSGKRNQATPADAPRPARANP